MAVAESITMKATQAMKMNMIFWNSPMPKSEKVSGIRAAMGMLRPHDRQRGEEGVHPAETAAENAQGHAHDRRQPETESHAPQAG